MQSNLEPNQYGLAIHTSSPQLGLALSNFADNSRSQVWDLGHDLSTHLHVNLAEFIKPQTWSDLGFIAVAKGPGGFTGTRIGVVTARTLAQQLEIPLFAISTLAAAAWAHFSQLSTPPTLLENVLVIEEKRGISEDRAIAIQMPAQRSQLFAAIYQVRSSDSGLTALLPDTVLTPDKWQHTLDNWKIPYELIRIPAGVGLGTSVSSLLELAYLNWQQDKRPHWADALPFYGQHPVEV
ncbi:MAG TPA: tRNA (adenosine(37)-N6)-threonylcarbamoyltransferase complex dimerization subunit type 1 TsaB [Allocoleopsis sp.]